jgi:hypothetical protein
MKKKARDDINWLIQTFSTLPQFTFRDDEQKIKLNLLRYNCYYYCHNHHKYINVLLSTVRSVTFSFSSLEFIYMLHFALLRFELEFMFAVWNAITSAGTNKLEYFQQKLAALWFNRFLPLCPKECLVLHTYCLDALHLIEIYLAFLFLKFLVFKFLFDITENVLCSMSSKNYVR